MKAGQRNEPLLLPEKVTLVWLKHNVPIGFWLSVGTAILIIFGLGVTVGQTTFIKEIFNKKTEAPIQQQTSPPAETKNNSANTTPIDKANTDSLKMSEPTPIQISEEISKAPPLQQADIARRYEGIKVDWELIFIHAEEKGNDNVLVLLAPGDSAYICWVRLGVKLSRYKELSIMDKGKKIRVEGTIYNADPLYVTLQGVKLTY